MFKKGISIIVIFYLFLVSAVGCSSQKNIDSVQIANEEISAKQAYEIALPYANKWEGDAILDSIDNFAGGQNKKGLFSAWNITFYSRTLDKSLKIEIVDGKYKDEDNKIANKKVVNNNWIDSTIVMENARSYFDEEQCKSIWLGLSEDTWHVKCSRSGGNPKWVLLKADTGDFIREYEGY